MRLTFTIYNSATIANTCTDFNPLETVSQLIQATLLRITDSQRYSFYNIFYILVFLSKY